MNFQHLALKIFIQKPIVLDPVIPIFHQWIQQKVGEELWIDVADYRHVPAGPGVMLIGHEANVSVDENEERQGLLYQRKAILDANLKDQLLHLFRSAFLHARRLETTAELNSLKFDASRLQLVLNDRLLAPNNDESFAILKKDLEPFLAKIYPEIRHTLSRHQDPRKRLTIEIQFDKPSDLETVLQRLGSA